MVHDDSLDHDKKIKIENFLHKLSEKEYSEDDISKAEKKAEASYKSRLSDIWDRVRILFLIARHPSIWGPQMALLATIAVIYLVSPVDVIPDLIPVAGLSDDIAVIGAIAALIIKSLSGYSREKLKAIRAEVPDDLRAAFDEMFKLKAEEEQDAGNLDDEQKKKVMASVEKLGTTAGIDAFSEIDDKLPSMNRGSVQAVWDKVQFMWNKFRSGCTGLEKILVTGALLYLILPADVIPDFLPGVGLVDDVFAITYVYYKIGGGKEKAAEALCHFTDKVADRIRVRIEPMIEQKVQQELEKWNKDRLLLSLMNLLIYLRNVSEKKIRISHICYGMLEMVSELGYSPIVEMKNILEANDWISGAYSFLEFGDAYKIAELLGSIDENLKQKLVEFSNVKNLNYLAALENQCQQLLSIRKNEHLPRIAQMVISPVIENFIKQLNIKADDPYRHSNFQYHLACWQYDNHNYAAAYISLNEAIVTRACEEDGRNPLDYGRRESMKHLFGILRQPEDHKSDAKKRIEAIIADKANLTAYAYLFKEVSSNRNAIAHNRRGDADNPQRMIEDLANYLNKYKLLIFG